MIRLWPLQICTWSLEDSDGGDDKNDDDNVCYRNLAYMRRR